MLKYLVPVLFTAFFLHAQGIKDDVVAKAGDREITKNEFQARFDLNPQIQIQRKNQGEANKQVFLYGLIAEKLLAQDASDNGLDTIPAVRFYIKNFEKMFVRDELYRREIKEKSKKYAADILSFYLENSSKIFTKVIISEDEKEINNIYTLLKTGVPFDSLYNSLSPAEKDTITLFAGTLDELTEHKLFTLPEKSFTEPLQYNEHRVIFYIDKKNDPVLAHSMGWESEYKRLEKAASEKAEGVFYKDYMKKFFPGKTADANGYLIKSLAEKILPLLRRDSEGKFTVLSSDYVNIARTYPADTLNMTFIRIPGSPVSFIDFLYWLRTENFQAKDSIFQSAASVLNSKAKKYSEFELLAGEGYRQGLDKSENVKKSLAMWKDNYLYQLRLSSLSDSLFTKGNENTLFKVIEIVNSSLDVMEKILNEVSDKKDFTELAYRYSSVKPDTSYRPLSSLGEIRDEVMQINNHDIYGPLHSERGYILFKIADKKTVKELTGSKPPELENPFNNYISRLAVKYGISINPQVLAEVENSNINALVFRYLGFGGRLSAVPVIVPVSEWYKDYKETAPLNP